MPLPSQGVISALLGDDDDEQLPVQQPPPSGLISHLAREEPEPEPGPTAGDFGKAVMSGGPALVGGLGWAIDRFIPGGETIGKAMQEVGDEGVDFWLNGQKGGELFAGGLSQGAKRALGKQVIKKAPEGEGIFGYTWGDAGLDTIGLMAAQSILGTMLGMGAGGALTKGLQAAGVGTKTAGAIGYGLGESGVAAPMAAKRVGDDIRKMPHEDLMRSPEYAAYYESLGEIEDREDTAREYVSGKAADLALAMTGLSTLALSAPMGTLIGKFTAGMPLATTLPRSVATGVAGEAGQEFLQSGAERFGENVAIQKYADPTQDLIEGVVEEAFAGGAAGGLMGGAFGLGGRTQVETPAIENLPAEPGSLTSAAKVALGQDPAVDLGAGIPYTQAIMEQKTRQAAGEEGLEVVPHPQNPKRWKVLSKEEEKAESKAATEAEKAPEKAEPEPAAEPIAEPAFSLQEEQPDAGQIRSDEGQVPSAVPEVREEPQVLPSAGETEIGQDFQRDEEAGAETGDEEGGLAKVTTAEEVTQQAEQAATSPANDKPQPTQAQKEAGNYEKGHISLQGMDISIENPQGSKRSGTDEDGKAWSVTMKSHYGYLKGTVGKDKDHLDVFLGEGATDPDLPVFVVDQVNPSTGEFDEHKIMLGFEGQESAKAGYLANYAKGWKGIGEITEMPVDQFKDWIASGDTKSPVGLVAPDQAEQPEQPGVADELIAPTAVPPVTAKQQTTDNFLVRYKQVEVGQIRSGLDTVNSASDVAHVVASIRKHAQETMLAVVTDDSGKILNVIRHSKGIKDASAVSPVELASAIAATPGSTRVWFAHNHPSGTSRPSKSDAQITALLNKALVASGVTVEKHLVIGSATSFDVLGKTGGYEARNQTIKPMLRRRTLGITERLIRKVPPKDRDAVDTPDSAKAIINKLGTRNGLLLLDNQKQVLGVVTLSLQEQNGLRAGKRVRRILTAIDSTNAASGIVISTDAKSALNLGNYLNRLGSFSLIDVMVYDYETGELESRARSGKPLKTEGPFFSKQAKRPKRTGPPKLEPKKLILAAWKNQFGPRVVANILANREIRVVSTQDQLPQTMLDAALSVNEGAPPVIGGVVDPDTGISWIVAENAVDNPVGLLLHEVGVHYGMYDMLGDKRYGQLMGELAGLRESGDKAVLDAFDKIPANTRSSAAQWLIDEENLGYLVENPANHNLPIVQRLMAWLKQWAFRVFGPSIAGKLTADDLVSLALASVRHTANQTATGKHVQSVLVPADARYQTVYHGEPVANQEQAVGEAEEPSLSVAAQINTPEFKEWFSGSQVVDENGDPLVVYHGTTETKYVPGERAPGDKASLARLQEIQDKVIADGTFTEPVAALSDLANVLERVGHGLAKEARAAYEKSKSREISKGKETLGFSVFEPNEMGSHFGTHTQASARGEPFAFFLSIKNPLRLPDLGTWDYQKVLQESRKAGVPISKAEYDSVSGEAATRDLLISKGYDGIVYENEAEGAGDSYIAFKPEQIRSEAANPDIRFSIKKPTEEQAAQEIEQLQAQPGSPFTHQPKYDWINNADLPDDIKKLISQVSEQNPEKMMLARDGVQTWDMINAAAEKLGMDPKNAYEQIVGRKKGEAWNAAQLSRGMAKLVESTEDLETVIIEYNAREADGSLTSQMRLYAYKRLMQHAELQAQVLGAVSEAGRALGIMRQYHDKTLGIQDVDDMLVNVQGEGGLDEVMGQLGKIRKPKGRAGINQHVRKIADPNWWDKLYEAWISSLLSGPRTHIVNVSSNALVAMNEDIVRFVAAGFGAVSGNADRVTFGEALSRFTGTPRAGLAFRLMGMMDTSVVSTKALLAGFKDENAVDPNLKIEVRHAHAIKGLKGKIIRQPLRALNAEDMFFKALNFRKELAAIAYREATKAGAIERVQSFMEHPKPEWVEEAALIAQRATFTERLGENMNAIQLLLGRVPVLRLIAPFVRTPTNIIKYAARHSILGIAFKDMRADYAAKGARRHMALARMSFGTSLMMTATFMAMQGLLTGGGPGDKEKRRLWRELGWQPYSIRLGDTYYAYNRFEPIGILFGIAADMKEVGEAATAGEMEELLPMALGAVAQNLTSKTWLKGVSDMVAAVNEPHKMKYWIEQFSGTLVPTGLAQISDVNDPILRRVDGIMDKIRSRIPGLREQLPPRFGMFDKPITRENTGYLAFSPVYVSTIVHDPLVTEMVRHSVGFGKLNQQWGGVELTVQQHQDLQRTVGAVAHKYGTLLVQSRQYQDLSPYPWAQRKALKRALGRFRSAGRAQFLAMMPELKREMVRAKRAELMNPATSNLPIGF